MQYTGDACDVCPISFAPVADLERPVGFDAAHAFECQCIVEWLTRHKCTNPLTGRTYCGARVADIVHPLVVGGRCEHVPSTQQMLSRAGRAVGARGCGAAVKFASDVLLLLLQILSSLSVRGNTIVTAPLTDILTMALLIACILRENPVRGGCFVVMFFVSATMYTLLGVELRVFAPSVTTAVMMHIWSTSLYAAKLSLDVMTEAFGIY